MDSPAPRRFLTSLFGSVFWIAIFGWLWLGAAPLARMLGLAWAALGFYSPAAYLFSLALALPWFGNNPGGPHLLYLWDMGMMGCVAGHLARRGLGRIQKRPHALDPWVTLFVICAWVGLLPQLRWLRLELLFEKIDFMVRIYTHSFDAEVYGLRMALDLTLCAGLYVTMRDRPWPVRRQLALLATLLAALAFTSVAGLLQYSHLISLDWWRDENPERGLWGHRRLQSLYWHPGWFSEYLSLIAPAAIAWACVAWRHPRHGMARWGWTALALLLGVTQLLTLARAGWLATAASCLVIVLAAAAPTTQRSRARWQLLRRACGAIFVLALIVGTLALLSNDVRLRLGEMLHYRERTDIWTRALRIIRDYTISGIGIGEYTHFNRLNYPNDAFALTWITAHNQILHLWLERGLFGVVLFLGIVVAAWMKLWRRPQSEADPNETNLAAQRGAQIVRLALLGGFAAFVVDGFFQYNFYLRVTETMFWIFAGWTTWITPAAPQQISRAATRWKRFVVPATSLLMLAAMIHKNEFRLRPWRIGLAEGNFHTGGKEVRIKIPQGAHRLRMAVATIDSSVPKAPVTYTVALNGVVLTSATLTVQQTQSLKFNLPPHYNPGDRLTLAISRTWSPWGYGMHATLPLMELGVMWLDPKKIN